MSNKDKWFPKPSQSLGRGTLPQPRKVQAIMARGGVDGPVVWSPSGLLLPSSSPLAYSCLSLTTSERVGASRAKEPPPT
jgi:hypothetical protein